MINSLDIKTIDEFRAIINQRLGLQFDDSKREFLAEVMKRRIEKTRSCHALSYFNRLISEQPTPSEIIALAEELTVGETYFYRHPDQFRAFTDVALLPRLHRGSDRSAPQILSAGCSSGEEAYTAAILLSQYFSSADKSPATILGIDINSASLDKATKAQYSAWSLRGTSIELRQRYFRGEKTFVLDESIRSLVRFENHNLMGSDDGFWRTDRFDVIFCRNVLMYFTPEAARNVVARLTRSLVPGGYLFLGPAETLRGLSQEYHLRHTHDTFYYQRRSRDEVARVDFQETFGEPQWFEPVQPVIDSEDTAWIDAIGRASDRIEKLSRKSLAESTPYATMSNVAEPANVAALSHQASEAKLDLIRELVRQARFAEALTEMNAFSPVEQNDADVQLLRAVVFTNCGHVTEAEQLCRRVLAGDELNAEAHYLLALCQEHGNDYAAAIEQDETALYLDGHFAMPHLHLGLLCKRIGDMPRARQSFERALSLLSSEDTIRVMIFGGGFSREMLINLCQAELHASRGAG